MLTYEEFKDIVEEELELLPEYVYKELNGGVLVEEYTYMHPARVADDLYILGIYSVDPILGKQIRLYYGSFMATMGYRSIEDIRLQVRDTVRHEFLHHLETNAGLFGKGTLIEEDRDRMRTYYMRHREID
ncbi:MAG: metallopeptidase family protein [Blautia sp.]|nr:metallopeptidase family protein [Blautia sp.]